MGSKAASLYLFLAVVIMINIPEISATACNYEVIKPSSSYDGYIMSPDYPSTYLSDLCHIWVYYGQPGWQVTISFVDVDIPKFSGACWNDFLRIGPLNGHTYCGSIYENSFAPYTAEFTDSDYLLYVVFNSTSFGTKGRGFKIYFQLWNDNGMPPPTTTTVRTTTPELLYSTQGLKSDDSLCRFILANDTGYITTDKTVLDCLSATGKVTWQIFYPSIGDTDFKCEIIFEECSVPYPDKLSVYDGYSNEDSLLGEYFTGLCPNFLISKSSSIFLEYTRKDAATLPRIKLRFMKMEANRSDKVPSYDNTKASYPGSTETPLYRHISTRNPLYDYSNECAFRPSNESGEINSADIASLVKSSGFCTWLFHFEARDGQFVTYTLKFERFHLSPESTFIVYDGADMTAPVLGRYVPLAPSLALMSSQSSVFVYFNPGINVDYVGVNDFFSVKYEANNYKNLFLDGKPTGQIPDTLFNLNKSYNWGTHNDYPFCSAENVCIASDYTYPSWIRGKNRTSFPTLQCLEDYLPCGYGELACYRNNQRCDNTWDCPLHGGDERGCFIDCPGEFSCGFTASICYSENERCNGKAFCQNSLDELACNEAQCSPDKGLFLCRSGHCIYENLRCDKQRDCMDNSDEENCSVFMSTRITIAAVGASLICALILVVTMGCVCKVYHMRTRSLRESQRYETPLTRHLSEMLRQRAPPPPYHEAMLTSRPYSEDNLELIDNNDRQEGLGHLNTAYHDDIPASSRQETQRWQDNGYSLQDQVVSENQHQAPSRNISGNLIEVGTLAFFSESVENDGPYWHADGHEQTDDSELPPYSETDPASISGSHPSALGGESCHDGSWHGGFGSGVFTGDNSHARSTSEFLIQMEMMPSVGAQHSASAQTAPSMASNSDGMKSVPQRRDLELTNGGRHDSETISTSSRLFIDSTGDKDMTDTESEEMREDVDILEVDSDSECILAEDNASDDNSELDTCILVHD